ncbi:MAG: hypothetical protein II743_01165 [Lachnospiraceae bacterium]|nr:hypothetical protein [Lachnospiraceae bacterium]
MNKLFSILIMMITLVTSYTGNTLNLDQAKAYPDSPKWVTQLGSEKEATQLFVVAAVGQTTAYVSMHEKDENGKWKEIMTTPGYIGKNGLGKTKEGDGKTPSGTFHFNAAFGIAKDPGCAIPYHQVTKYDYWSADPRKGYAYNQLVSTKDYPDLDVKNKYTEHLIDCDPEYQYCLNISYNEECTPGVGGAIFLHCFGEIKPFTGGCVAIPEDCMLQVMQNVKPDCVVVIDSLKTLSPETWKKIGLQ